MPPRRPATGQTSSAPTVPSFTRRAAGAPAHAHTSHDAPTTTNDSPPAEISTTGVCTTAGSDVAGAPHESWADALRRTVGERNYDHWFAGRTTIDCHDRALTIGVASAFIVSWMQKSFHATVLGLARQRLGEAATVRFLVDVQAITADRSEATAARRPSLTASAGLQSPVPRRNSPVSRAEASPSVAALSPIVSVPIIPSTIVAGPFVSAIGTALMPVVSGVTLPARSQPAMSSAVGSRSESSEPSPAKLSRRLADLADFVSGAGNELAFVAAQQVSQSPGARFNPLYLHGGVGIGKTHLLEGIHRQIRRNVPHLNVMLLSAEAFANQFTDALRSHALPSFRSRFRTVDALLIDDVDFFDGKQVIQEEFLHTFKQLEALGRQIVATCDRHPRLLMKTSDELVSRLQSGLVCRIENPDLETRRRIASSKAARLDADIAPEALALVAQRFTNNVRELEGALQSLATWHHLTQRRVTASMARKALADLERDCVRVVRVGDIEQTVCRFFGVSADDLRSARRTRTLSQPRMLAMFLARKLTQAAYGEIGQHFGGRNHSTVMSAERKVQEWLSEGATIRIAAQSYPLSELLETLEQQAKAS